MWDLKCFGYVAMNCLFLRKLENLSENQINFSGYRVEYRGIYLYVQLVRLMRLIKLSWIRVLDMSGQYIYTMNRVSKVVSPNREILKDISISFFPGAKIGVLGLNGAGKSTLLRIMAGVDTNIQGEAR